MRASVLPTAPSTRSTRRLRAGLLASLVGLGACQREPAAELLEVNRVSATEVQFGEALSIAGDGFALGKSILVRFRGQVYRAGVEARQVDVALRARAESQRELSVPLPRETQAQFCGAGAEAAHATFRGELQVAIAARQPGAPPVTGTLRGTTLEFYPALEPSDASLGLPSEGRRALEFYGLDVTSAADVAAERGLSVVSVAPGSRAASAALEPGDRIVRAGGLSVLEPSDLVPEPSRGLALGVLRAGVPRSVVLDADGFRSQPPTNLRWAALLAGVAALTFLLRASPLQRLLSSLVHAWLAQRRARRAAPLGRPGVSLAQLLAPLGGSRGALVWLAVGAALLAPLIRGTPIDLGLGLMTLCCGSATLLTAASVIDGGRRGARWSLWLGVRAAFAQWLALVPAWIAIVASCFPSGLDVDELVRAQGPLPDRWNAFANPGFTVLFGVLLLSALPTHRRSPGRLRHARSSAALGRHPESGWLAAIHSCSLCAVAALAFLGGDAWPGSAEAAGPAASAARLLPSALLWLKYTGLYCGVTLLGALLERATLSDWTPLRLRTCLPLSLAAAALAGAWRALEGRSDFWRWTLSGYGPALLALMALALLALPWRLLASLRRPDPAPGLSPWL